MRGKVGLVIGLATGYVLGTRAGRERYEQIKAQAQKVWELDPVQKQVDKVKDFAKSSVMALPGAVWNTAVKVTKAATKDGTPGEKLDATLKVAKESAPDIKAGAVQTADELKDQAADAYDDLTGRGGA